MGFSPGILNHQQDRIDWIYQLTAAANSSLYFCPFFCCFFPKIPYEKKEVTYYLLLQVVGGWTNPLEKNESKWESSTNRGEKNTYWKPTPSICLLCNFWLAKLEGTLSFFCLPNAWGLSLFRLYSKTCNKTTGFPQFRFSLLKKKFQKTTEGLKLPRTLPKKRPSSWPFVVETRRSRRNHVHPGGKNWARPMGWVQKVWSVGVSKKKMDAPFLGSPLSPFFSPAGFCWSTITAIY